MNTPVCSNMQQAHQTGPTLSQRKHPMPRRDGIDRMSTNSYPLASSDLFQQATSTLDHCMRVPFRDEVVWHVEHLDKAYCWVPRRGRQMRAWNRRRLLPTRGLCAAQRLASMLWPFAEVASGLATCCCGSATARSVRVGE